MGLVTKMIRQRRNCISSSRDRKPSPGGLRTYMLKHNFKLLGRKYV